jgi:tellurite resistance protein TehA-like permease
VTETLRTAQSRTGIREAVRTLNPGYFALVMATGILSMAMYHQHAYALSVALLWLTGVEFIVLLAVTAIRIVEHIGDVESWLALAVWTLTFVAMLHHLAVTIGLGSRMPRMPRPPAAG